MIQFSLKSPS